MQKLRNICIVLNIISGLISYMNGDTANLMLAIFLIVGFYFIGLIEDRVNDK